MYSSFTIKKSQLLILFAALFPIMPYYFTIFRFNANTILCIVLFIGGMLGGLKAIYLYRIHSYLLGVSLAAWIVINLVILMKVDSLGQTIVFFVQTFGLYIAFMPLIKQRVSFLSCIRALVYTSGVVAVFGIVEEIVGFNIFSLLNNTNAALNYNSARFGMTRIISYSAQTIVYGLYIMFCMVLILYLLQFDSKKAERIKLKTIYVLLWINLLLTFSRSSIIAAVIAQILFWVLSSERHKVLKTFKWLAILAFGLGMMYLIFPQIRELLSNSLWMILALFDDKYTSLISGTFGENLGGVGNRIDLYQWVSSSMPGHWLFGYGVHTPFEYEFKNSNGMYSWYATKKGIEVQYLNLLYHKGLLGMISETVVYIALLFTSFVSRRKASWEVKTGFNTVVFSVLFSYFLAFFSVNQSSDVYIFYIFVLLYLGYNRFKKYEEDI